MYFSKQAPFSLRLECASELMREGRPARVASYIQECVGIGYIRSAHVLLLVAPLQSMRQKDAFCEGLKHTVHTTLQTGEV
jgi:hypothetical protein